MEKTGPVTYENNLKILKKEGLDSIERMKDYKNFPRFELRIEASDIAKVNSRLKGQKFSTDYDDLCKFLGESEHRNEARVAFRIYW